MSHLPRFNPGQTIKGKDLNLLISVIDVGGPTNLESQTNSGITGQDLVPTVPITGNSTTASALPQAFHKPITPQGLNATVGIDYFSQAHDGFAVLSWTPSPVSEFISRYDLYYHKGSDEVLHNLTVGGDVSQARITSLIPGQTYIFAIQSHDAANRASDFSPELSVYIPLDVDPPAVPSGLTLTAFTKAIFVQWTEVGPEGISNDLKQYQIQIDTSSSFNVSPYIATVGPGNSYYYPYASSGTILYFRIRSCDWTGNVSAWSNTSNATVG